MAAIRTKIRCVLMHLSLYVNKYPFFKSWIIRVLGRFPTLKKKIYKLMQVKIQKYDSGIGVRADLSALLERLADQPPVTSGRQLFVDISELLRTDGKSGIQRVVRSVLRQLCIQSLKEFRVEPVYAIPGTQGYRYVRHLCPEYRDSLDLSTDEFIKFDAGDVFLGLDLQPQIVLTNQPFYQQLRQHGVRVEFVVYDLLPVLMPQAFAEGTYGPHQAWLEVIAQGDGAICISQAVADELKQWLAENELLQPAFKIDWFHLGADIDASVPSKGKPDQAVTLLNRMSERPAFLMVGTLEPRKGHRQVLAAFDLLWNKGVEASLVIVGKRGWIMDKFVEYMSGHPESGRRLFWIEGASDEYLESIYAASVCLIAASEGEGFGLPLIEAAQHHKCIIARDIPVFREVAKGHALYFSGVSPVDLAKVVENWLALFQQGQAPSSEGMSWLTWEQSTKSLLAKLLPKN